MSNFKFKRMMHEEVAQRNRNCMLCNEPIKKKQVCYTISVSGRIWPTKLHIHKWHCKPISIKTCKSRMKCLTDNNECNSILCKNRRTCR